MKLVLHHLLFVFLFIVGVGAQTQKPTDKPVATTPTTAPVPEPLELPLTPDKRAQIRDLQYQIDQAQIKIEQLKEQQIQWTDDISTIATDFARISKVDINQYELDAVNLRLRRKQQQVPLLPAPTQPSELDKKKDIKK